MTRAPIVTVVLACALTLATSHVRATQSGDQTATAVIRFAPPAALPDRAVEGKCRTPSTAAWFRADAWGCETGSSTYDPCFRTGPAGGQVWCVSDPRQPGSGTLLNAGMLAVTHASSPPHRSWFFELTDGSTCRPLSAAGRVVEGEHELYTCKYGSAGEADAVLGDLDSSTPIWTIHKVLINKKAEPQTVKSLAIAPVRTVWQ